MICSRSKLAERKSAKKAISIDRFPLSNTHFPSLLEKARGSLGALALKWIRVSGEKLAPSVCDAIDISSSVSFCFANGERKLIPTRWLSTLFYVNADLLHKIEPIYSCNQTSIPNVTKPSIYSIYLITPFGVIYIIQIA